MLCAALGVASLCGGTQSWRQGQQQSGRRQRRRQEDGRGRMWFDSRPHRTLRSRHRREGSCFAGKSCSWGLGPWRRQLTKTARTWVQRLSTVLTMDLDCQVAEPLHSTEDLDRRGYWFNPVARSDEMRVKILRKQAFAGLSSMLQHIAGWKPDIISLSPGASSPAWRRFPWWWKPLAGPT